MVLLSVVGMTTSCLVMVNWLDDEFNFEPMLNIEVSALHCQLNRIQLCPAFRQAMIRLFSIFIFHV